MRKKNVLILGTLLVLLLMSLTGCGKTEQKSEDDVNSKTESAEHEEEFVEETSKELFPCELENGKLNVDSLFQFTGFNPDCGSEEGEDIAGLQFTNTSEQHLTEVKFALTLENGTVLEFLASDVPAGKSVMAFSSENVSITSADIGKELTCEVTFEESSPLMADKLSYILNGTEITVTNISGEDLSGVNVYCHSVLDETYFGGVTYCYTIDSLATGQSASVDAIDCFLGAADVVRIDINN